MEVVRDMHVSNRLYYEKNKDKIIQKRQQKDDIVCPHCQYKTKRMVDFNRHCNSICHKINSGHIILLD